MMMTEIEFVTRLGLALLFGGMIGMERQWRQRMAGLRTNALVSVGAALFVMLGAMTPGETSLPRIAAQVVSGIGFLGAGVIMREGISVQGLTTAATLWCAAAIGTLAGAGLRLWAASGAVAVLIIHILLRPLARTINRQPRDTAEVETYYCFRAVCRSADESHIRALLLHMVNGGPLMLRSLYSEDLEMTSKVEVKANLVSAGRNDGCWRVLSAAARHLAIRSGAGIPVSHGDRLHRSVSGQPIGA
jgi:putative Mg2+ transporter-C (MgtC) family protein